VLTCVEKLYKNFDMDKITIILSVALAGFMYYISGETLRKDKI